MSHLVRRLLPLTIAFLLLTASAQAPEAERIVAIGDIHGDLDALVAILQKAGFIDEARHWSGGKATLVQTGDFLDRGPKSRAVMDLLMALQKEASRRDGRVLICLGNHEVMNMMGDLRYVVPEDYSAFADSKSEQRRKTAFQNYSRQQVERGRPVDETTWMRAHPIGFIEHREAFGPRGVYGRWLRSLPAVRTADDSVFLHGGISPELATRSVEKINAAVSAEIQAFDKYRQYMVDQKLAFPFSTFDELVNTAKAEVEARQSKPQAGQEQEDRERLLVLENFLQLGGWLSISEDGPLWFRGYDSWTEEEGEARLSPLTKALNVKRIVVGHTPQPSGEVRRRFGGKVFLIDTGMLSSYFPGGRAAVLDIRDGKLSAIYPNETKTLN